MKKWLKEIIDSYSDPTNYGDWKNDVLNLVLVGLVFIGVIVWAL